MGAVPADGAVGVAAGGWRVARRAGPAGDHHARDVGATGRLVELLVADAPALVLGSTQPADDADEGAARAEGVAVVRRRSGGGAVLVGPGEGAWIDVTIPRDDPLWDDDVARAFGWLGRCWADALASLGVEGAEVHAGPLRDGPWSRQVCFAGLGPGEVTVGGRKLVGISQRRTRDGARFQCMVHRRWEPAALVQLLGLPPEAAEDLREAAVGLDVPADRILAALVSVLP